MLLDRSHGASVLRANWSARCRCIPIKTVEFHAAALALLGLGLALANIFPSLSLCRVAMPISGLGREASAEAASYEAVQAALLRLRMPYALGASEIVSVGLPSCA